MKKNYIIPQMDITSVNHLAALCARSETTLSITIGGTTSASAITDGD